MVVHLDRLEEDVAQVVLVSGVGSVDDALRIAVDDGVLHRDGLGLGAVVGIHVDENALTAGQHLEVVDGEGAHLAAELERAGDFRAVLADEAERSGDREHAAQVVGTRREGDLRLAGADGGEQLLGVRDDEGVVATAAALRQHREGGHAGCGFGVVDVVGARVGIDFHLVAARIEHAGGGAADHVLSALGHGVGLAAEHHGVAGGAGDGLPGDGDVGGVAGGDGGRVGDGLRRRQGRIDRGDVGAPGQLLEGDRAGREDVHEGFLGDGGDDDLGRVGHIGHRGDAALEGDGTAVDRADAHDEVVAGGVRIGRLHEHGARSGDLEGHIAQGRDALAVGHGRRLELELAAARHDGVGLAAADEEVVTDHLLLDGAGEVLRVREVPGLVAGEDVQGEVLRLLHERGPPLGRAHLLVSDLAVGQEVEIAARSVVARIGTQDGTGGIGQGEVVGEVDDVAGIIRRQVVEPVVRGRDAQVARRDILGVGAREDGLAGEVQEQVVLEGERARGDLETEHARVVRVVHEVQVLQGVVLEHERAD